MISRPTADYGAPYLPVTSHPKETAVDDPQHCPECGSTDLTAYSYDGGQTTTGYECRDCGHNWRATENA